MNLKVRLRFYFWFLLKAVVTASAVMFASMSAGELLIDPNLFSGFLKRPSIWPAILIETSIATLLFCLVGLCILSCFRRASKKAFMAASLATWIFLSVGLAAVYGYFYWPREWRFTILAPGLLFGWIVPGCLTVGCFILFSLDFQDSRAVR